LTRAATLVFYITPTVLTGPILFTLTSNIGRRKMMLTFQVAVFTVLAIGGLDRFVRTGKLRVNSYSYFAENSPRSVDYRHYADQRPTGERYAHVAYIRSEVVSGPYLELFVPYTPSEDNAAVAARCPSVAPLARNGMRFGRVPFVESQSATAALECLAGLHPVTLDGLPVQPAYDFYRDPASGLQGMLAHIPAASLAPGRHVLTVAAPNLAGDSSASMDSREFIPFWR
jgi:hypothetical protein